jgi:hypothetical protein
VRKFDTGGVHSSHGLNLDTGRDEEFVFVVLGPSVTVTYYLDPIQYWAINLYTGEKFEFHRDSITADNARPCLSST